MNGNELDTSAEAVDDEIDEGWASVESPTDGVEASANVRRRQADWSKILIFGVLPGSALALGSLAGFLKWQEVSRLDAATAATESIAVARDTTVAILSYKPDTVEQELNSVRDRLTGSFRDDYAKLVNEVVIPGAKQKKISAVAQVPATASVSANSKHAVALVFVDQTVTMGNDAPTNTSSTVRVTLDKVDGRWLVSGFDPV